MNFTVLGASGFIGSRLVNHLRSTGHVCFAPMRDDPIIPERNLGHVVYCIGLTADFRERPIDTIRAHVCRLADVLETSRFDSLLYLSSTRVYRDATDTREDARLTASPCVPDDLYNLSKLAGEALCLACESDTVRVARLSNVIGVGPTSETFFTQVLRQALLQGRIELRTTLDSVKDYISIDDVVEILPRLAVDGKKRIYNVASGINISHREIIERLVALTGCEIALSPDARLSRFPPVDIERIRAEFRFSPASVLDTLPGLVAAYRTSRTRVPTANQDDAHGPNSTV